MDLVFGWAAILSAVATLGTAITGILFFAVDERLGRTNDIVSVFQVVLMLPVAIAMYALTRTSNAPLALTALAVGGAGLIVAAVLQTLLVLGKVSFETTIGAALTAGAAMGLWLVLANVLALTASVLPLALAACGIVAGVGYLLTAVGFRRGGQQDPLFYAGSALTIVGYMIWAIWLGRVLLSGALRTGV